MVGDALAAVDNDNDGGKKHCGHPPWLLTYRSSHPIPPFSFLHPSMHKRFPIINRSDNKYSKYFKKTQFCSFGPVLKKIRICNIISENY